jgi:Uma2 family endonuclease
VSVLPPEAALEDAVALPRGVVRFPVELVAPAGFQAQDPSTWPRLHGRLEYVNGRLLYMPPCGALQQGVAVMVIALLVEWVRAHPEYFVGGNAAGMKLGRDVRAADAAVWRRADVTPATPRFPRLPPLLAVEVAGQEETEATLREKARWYQDAGVEIVWLVLPETREVLVLHGGSETRYRPGETIDAHPTLPGLTPAVADLFAQIDGRVTGPPSLAGGAYGLSPPAATGQCESATSAPSGSRR